MSIELLSHTAPNLTHRPQTLPLPRALHAYTHATACCFFDLVTSTCLVNCYCVPATALLPTPHAQEALQLPRRADCITVCRAE